MMFLERVNLNTRSRMTFFLRLAGLGGFLDVRSSYRVYFRH